MQHAFTENAVHVRQTSALRLSLLIINPNLLSQSHNINTLSATPGSTHSQLMPSPALDYKQSTTTHFSNIKRPSPPLSKADKLPPYRK
jgi:hypothetical protein